MISLGLLNRGLNAEVAAPAPRIFYPKDGVVSLAENDYTDWDVRLAFFKARAERVRLLQWPW